MTNDPYGTKELQGHLVKIMDFVDRVCRENHFTYYLSGGTLLGAVRHKGFIPWDDDLDIWMPRGDYMRFLEYMRSVNKDPRYIINEGPHKPHGDRPSELQMRILDIDLRIKRQFAGTTIVAHPWIDIFCLDNYPQTNRKAYVRRFKFWLFMYKVARCKHFLIPQDSFFGKMNKLVYTLHQKYKLFFFLNEEKYIQNAALALSKYQHKSCDTYYTYDALAFENTEKCLFPVHWFGEPAEITFEGRLFWAPKHYHEVLTKQFGDYMQPPPENQRRPTHSVELL